jgi:hypothetical protein
MRVCFELFIILTNTLRNVPEERRPQLHRGGSLKSRLSFFCCEPTNGFLMFIFHTKEMRFLFRNISSKIIL